MIYCPNCGKALPDGTRFCDECGALIANQAAPVSAPAPAPEPMPVAAPTAVPATAPMAAPAADSPASIPAQTPVMSYPGAQTPFCQNCGAPSTGTPFCQNCGAPMSDTKAAGKAKKEKKQKAPKTKGSGKKPGLVVGIIVAVILIVAAIIAIVLFAGKGKKKDSVLNNYLAYVMDGELYGTDFGKNGSIQITDNLVGNSDYDNEDIYDSAYRYVYYVQLSSDESFMLYPDRVGNSNYGLSIYMKDLGKKNNGAVKIDSDIVSYELVGNDKYVVYEKYTGSEYNLYVYAIKTGDKEKIASDIKDFTVSDNGKIILFTNNEGGLYYIENFGEKEKLDSDIVSFGALTDDCRKIYYLKGDVLYVREIGSDKVKIDSDVASVLKVNEDGTFYYTRSEMEEYKIGSLVIDDMVSTDANLEAPLYPEVPSSADYDSDDAYAKAMEEYDEAYEKYWDDLTVYYGKDFRESFRLAPDEGTYNIAIVELNYYDGTDKVTISKDFESVYYYPNDAAALMFAEYSNDEDPSVRFSELRDYSVSGITDQYRTNRSNSVVLRVVNGADIYDVPEVENGTNYMLSADAKVGYVVERDSDDYSVMTGTLHQFNVGDAETTVLDDDIYVYMVRTNALGVVYFKDINTNEYYGDMYLNGSQLDFEVYYYGVYYMDDADTLFYYTDYVESRDEGTLKMYKNGKITTISSDVTQYVPLADGSVAYMYDYSWNSYLGEAYLYKNGKKTKIADDVIYLVPTYYHNMY